MFYFAQPGGPNLEQRSETEWVVKFPGKDTTYTKAAMNDVSKSYSWCKLYTLMEGTNEANRSQVRMNLIED